MQPATPALLERFREGDTTAFDVLIRRYEASLRQFVLGHTTLSFRSEVPVDDLTQETHLEALSNLERFTYRRELSFFFWLCGIARRRIFHHARRLKRRPPILSLQAVSTADGASSRHLLRSLATSGTSAEALLQVTEQQHLIALGLARLPERRRRCLVLKYIEGHPSARAAELMGVSKGAFKILALRSLAQLRASLAELLGES